MAIRRRDHSSDSSRFSLTDEEITSLAKVLSQAARFSPSIDDCRTAARWAQFFLASETDKPGQFTEVEVLN